MNCNLTFGNLTVSPQEQKLCGGWDDVLLMILPWLIVGAQYKYVVCVKNEEGIGFNYVEGSFQSL